jgi:hypothetical protein
MLVRLVDRPSNDGGYRDRGNAVMNSVIAEMKCFGHAPGEERIQISIKIGMPYRWGENPEVWACPVAIEPLYHRLPDVRGEDSLQALCLAIRLAETLVAGFHRDGAALTNEDGSEFTFEAYFGPRPGSN